MRGFTEQQQKTTENCATTILRGGSGSAAFRPTASGHFASSPNFIWKLFVKNHQFVTSFQTTRAHFELQNVQTI